MFLVTKPSRERIDAFLTSQRNSGFSYPELGFTRSRAPDGYVVDHNRVYLGRGRGALHIAKLALQSWRMFDLGWVRAFPDAAPIEPGINVAVQVHHLGFWSLNACRVVYIFDEKDHYGFAYGTLHDHAEKGEERFSVEIFDDGSVWYDILAFSKPNQWQAGIARPISRLLQKRFARDSKQAMVRVTAGRTG
jgi:uncharacterized protein (UPF0548 family)